MILIIIVFTILYNNTITDYKINNKGEVERITVKGNHQPIVSEEEFDKVQEMLKSSITKKENGKT